MAVWMVMCKQPAMRAPARGFWAPYCEREGGPVSFKGEGLLTRRVREGQTHLSAQVHETRHLLKYFLRKTAIRRLIVLFEDRQTGLEGEKRSPNCLWLACTALQTHLMLRDADLLATPGSEAEEWIFFSSNFIAERPPPQGTSEAHEISATCEQQRKKGDVSLGGSVSAFVRPRLELYLVVLSRHVEGCFGLERKKEDGV